MDQDRFVDIATKYRDMTLALDMGAAPGERHFYNAYYRGTEVVVLGYTFQDPDGHSYTKPLSIIVDDEIFKALRVDNETARLEDGDLTDAKVI